MLYVLQNACETLRSQDPNIFVNLRAAGSAARRFTAGPADARTRAVTMVLICSFDFAFCPVAVNSMLLCSCRPLQWAVVTCNEFSTYTVVWQHPELLLGARPTSTHDKVLPGTHPPYKQSMFPHTPFTCTTHPFHGVECMKRGLLWRHLFECVRNVASTVLNHILTNEACPSLASG
jgi:hypothetical protein